MKVCVVVPPIKDFYYTPHRGSFLGAHIVFVLLKEYLNLDAELIVFPNLKKKPKTIPIPEELSYLEEYIDKHEIGPLSFFKTYKIFGPNLEECATFIAQKRPKLVFISCFAFCYSNETIELAQKIKDVNSRIKIVVGGGGVSVFPEYFKNFQFIDEIITTEAEIGILEFFGRSAVDFILPQITQTIETKDHIYYSTYLTRGCPKECKFCSVSLVHGKRLRLVDEEKFFDLVYKLPDKKVFLNFEDDNVLLAKRYFIKVLEKMRAIKKNILFSCENGIDYTQLDLSLLKRLVNLGFRQFNFSVGNINTKISEDQKRLNKLALLEELLDYLAFNKIVSITYFISGFKGENWKIALENLIYLTKLPTRVGFSPFYPVPGIEGFKDKSIFLKMSPRLACGSSMWPWNNSLSTQDMITLFRLTRFVNLWKKEHKTHEERDLLMKCIKDKRLYTFKKRKICEAKNYNKEMAKMFFEAFSLN